MSDIFISYAREDLTRARQLAETLQRLGWSMFWDRTIPAGKTWRQVIGAELDGARCVIVFWSQASVTSRFVLEEAQEGLDPARLIPILLDEVKLPLGFRSIQTADFSEWDGTQDAPVFRKLVDDLAALIGPPPAEKKQSIPEPGHMPATPPPATIEPTSTADEKVEAVSMAAGQAEEEQEGQSGEKAKGQGWQLPQPLRKFWVIVAGIGAPAALIGSLWFVQGTAPPEEEVPLATSLETSTAGKGGLAYLKIPAGEFQMGCVDSDTDCDPDEDPHPVTISNAFWMSRTEVTVNAYRRFANEGREGDMPDAPDFDSEWSKGNHPIVNVAWPDAVDYCEWDGDGRLPTEAEWEYAARGGRRGLKYPNGNDLAERDAHYDAEGTAPVGEFPPNRFGLHDMAGNVWEWVADRYSEDYYKNSPGKDPQGPDMGDYRVLRGGSWGNAPEYLRVSSRLRNLPGFRLSGLGFRCAREVSP